MKTSYSRLWQFSVLFLKYSVWRMASVISAISLHIACKVCRVKKNNRGFLSQAFKVPTKQVVHVCLHLPV